MADKKQKLLVIGMVSPNDMKNIEPVRLDGKPIDEYFKEKGIGVYRHPQPKDKEHPYLTTSIHRTTMESIKWAHDLQRLVEIDGHKLVAVLYGGLALALPGVVASEAPSVPIIGVGSDEDAFWNTYRIPDGNTDAIVPVGNLELGLLMAEKILQYDKTSVKFVTVGDCPNAEGVKKVLDAT
jgi:phosphoribosylcarboxyaminoimidazole (NCAIR) mutase